MARKFENVSFAYSKMPKDVLSDVNLEIASGETIGIIGLPVLVRQP